VTSHPTLTYGDAKARPRTVTIPNTEFTAARQPLIDALLAYPFPNRPGLYDPEALYTIAEELAAGRALSERALIAAEELLKLAPERDYEIDIDGFCPSCFHPIISSHSDYDLPYDKDEAVEGGIAYRFATYSNTLMCSLCIAAPGNMEGVTVTTVQHPALGPMRAVSNAPRYVYHPSEWPTQGYEPEDRGPFSPLADPVA
jgi:hypothetical protein